MTFCLFVKRYTFDCDHIQKDLTAAQNNGLSFEVGSCSIAILHRLSRSYMKEEIGKTSFW